MAVALGELAKSHSTTALLIAIQMHALSLTSTIVRGGDEPGRYRRSAKSTDFLLGMSSIDE